MASALAFAGVLAGCGDDVTVNPDPGITLTPPSATLQVGQSATFSATVSGLSNKTVNWTTSDAAKATVDATGKVTAVAAGTATITAAAAGDANVKASAIVTITGKGVNNITIAPPNAILAPGQTLQLGAQVDADAGVARTVTWTSSAATVATVGATTGVVTAVGPGSATITAASTVDPSVTGIMALTVRPITQAQISIQAITQAGTNQPVNISNVNGQIDVVLNVDPGDERVTSVAVTIDGTTACTRTLSASESEALRIAAAFEEVQAVDIVCSINTAAFNTTTGVASFLNGSRVIAATATVAGPPARTITATAQSVQFNNRNGYSVTTAFTGTTAQATDAAGFAFRRGGITATVVPVIYSGNLSIANGTLTFGSACDASGIGARTVALTGSGNTFTATLSQTGTPGTGNVANYEFDNDLVAACPALNTTGESFRLTATDTQGNTLFAAMQPADSATRTGIRLDNRAPGAPSFEANPNSRQNGWLNGAVALVGAYNATTNPNGWLVNGTADAGVGGYVRVMRQGAGPTVDAAIAATASTTPTLPAPSAARDSYCAVISARDLLGNESALPAAGAACTTPPAATATPVATQALGFGVDIAAPTIAFSGGLASNARINTATVGGEFQVTVTDTGTVGNSGMLSNAAVVGTVTLRNATATGAATCVVGTFTSGVCNPASVNAAPAFPLVPTTTIAANGSTGYFTYNAVAQDAAGNQSAAVTRVIAHDDGTNPANIPALTQALFNTPLTGPTVVFNANSSDNFDLRDATYSLTYASGFVAPIVYPAVTLNAFNVAPLVNSNVAAGISISGFIRQAEAQTSACNAALALGAAGKPVTLTGTVRDQANNSSAAVATGIPGSAVPNGTSYAGVAAAQQIFTFFVQNGVTGCPTGAAVNAAVLVSTGATSPATNPTSVTLNADVYGPTATLNPPFTRVDFYVLSGGNLVQIASATGVSTVDDGSANGRRHRYSASWTPGTGFGVGAQTIYAVGVNANGDALVTPSNANITLTNP